MGMILLNRLAFRSCHTLAIKMQKCEVSRPPENLNLALRIHLRAGNKG